MDSYENDEIALGVVAALMLSYAAIQLRRRNRRFKIRPINRERNIGGGFEYYKKMKRGDPEQFFKYTRMSVPVFENLLRKVKPSISKQVRRDGICPEARLVITLQYLSQGMSMQSLAWTFQIGITTVHKIIYESCDTIWDVLNPKYLKCPSTQAEWLEISEEYQLRWNFPHCIGSLDGKHINIQKPANSGSLFYNYKKSFSTVLLASCDSRYVFTMVDIGSYGSQSDGGIFKESLFGQKLNMNQCHIPGKRRLDNSNMEIPYYFAADEAFPLTEHIMRPYGGKNLTINQRIFNYRLSRARQVIENTFGILAARWRILKTTIIAKPDNIDKIVKAVTVLHNYCQLEVGFASKVTNIYCPPGYVDSGDQNNGLWREEESPLPSVGRMGANISKRHYYAIRDCLAEYLISPFGAVPWQHKIINKGLLFQNL